MHLKERDYMVVQLDRKAFGVESRDGWMQTCRIT